MDDTDVSFSEYLDVAEDGIIQGVYVRTNAFDGPADEHGCSESGLGSIPMSEFGVPPLSGIKMWDKYAGYFEMRGVSKEKVLSTPELPPSTVPIQEMLTKIMAAQTRWEADSSSRSTRCKVDEHWWQQSASGPAESGGPINTLGLELVLDRVSMSDRSVLVIDNGFGRDTRDMLKLLGYHETIIIGPDVDVHIGTKMSYKEMLGRVTSEFGVFDVVVLNYALSSMLEVVGGDGVAQILVQLLDRNASAFSIDLSMALADGVKTQGPIECIDGASAVFWDGVVIGPSVEGYATVTNGSDTWHTCNVTQGRIVETFHAPFSIYNSLVSEMGTQWLSPADDELYLIPAALHPHMARPEMQLVSFSHIVIARESFIGLQDCEPVTPALQYAISLVAECQPKSPSSEPLELVRAPWYFSTCGVGTRARLIVGEGDPHLLVPDGTKLSIPFRRGSGGPLIWDLNVSCGFDTGITVLSVNSFGDASIDDPLGKLRRLRDYTVRAYSPGESPYTITDWLPDYGPAIAAAVAPIHHVFALNVDDGTIVSLISASNQCRIGVRELLTMMRDPGRYVPVTSRKRGRSGVEGPHLYEEAVDDWDKYVPIVRRSGRCVHDTCFGDACALVSWRRTERNRGCGKEKWALRLGKRSKIELRLESPVGVVKFL